MSNPKANTVSFKKDVYVNREYSWLKFNKRVLDQASDPTNPLLERCKFLSIFSSNLDEFFMVRMGRLYDDNLLQPFATENKTGLTAAEQLFGLCGEIRKLYTLREAVFVRLRRELKEEDIRLLRYKDLSDKRRAQLNQYFHAKVLPILSPMVLDAKHPLLRFEHLSCYMVYKLKRGDDTMIGVMELSDKLEKIYKFRDGKKETFITMEEIIKNLGYLAFPGYEVSNSMMVRVTRNANFDAALDDADMDYSHDFPKFLKGKVENRPLQNAIRLEYSGESKTIRKFLLESVGIDERLMFPVENNFAYKYFYSLPRLLEKEKAEKLSYPPFKPKTPARLQNAASMVEEVRKKDVLLRYPFDSMNPLIRLLNECADRKDCIAIRITIYRLASHSGIVEALRRASLNGVEVTVVIELCARFDEENNLYFAGVLQEAGCNIIYGMENYKVHSKIISIVFSDREGIRYITHLGTGNYNESTAKQYTDLNVITADKEIGEDGAAFFRNLAICNVEDDYRRLAIAPKYLKKTILEEIDREIEKAKAGKPGVVLGKMNSLTDKQIIEKFVEASCAGVKIALVVRGICCLLPGKKDKTENISVKSIVGRFLEHSRIYCFGEGEDRRVYISSADLMTRNTDKRVEIATPVLDSDVAEEIYRMLCICLRDDVKGRVLLPNGDYIKEEGEALNSQEYFLAMND